MTVAEDQELEYQRLKKLSEFDLDYKNLQKELKNFVELAAHIAGTEISLVNLIDNYTQWTVSAYSSNLSQIAREESVCDHTIRADECLEVPRLDEDDRFRHNSYVTGKHGLKYYLGIPLKVETGEKIGALCVIDHEERKVSDEKKKLLQLIAAEIVAKLEKKKKMDALQNQVSEAIRQRNQMAHDVRGPLAGILGLAEATETEVLSEQEFRSYFEMVGNSASGLLELTDDILGKQKQFISGNSFTLAELQGRLEDLYLLPAQHKNLSFKVQVKGLTETRKFSRRKLLPIAGNLIANAIKFTPSGGEILVDLEIKKETAKNFLNIVVTDNGRGISREMLQNLGHSSIEGNTGTKGEKSFGLGFQLVTEMVESLHGELQIESTEGQGTRVTVNIPLR